MISQIFNVAVPAEHLVLSAGDEIPNVQIWAAHPVFRTILKLKIAITLA